MVSWPSPACFPVVSNLSAQELSPGYPRLVIPQQLPHQSASNMSPATLFLYGKLYTIALNGTLDGTSPYPYRSHLAAPNINQRNLRNLRAL